jgi:hypothetical protein
MSTDYVLCNTKYDIHTDTALVDVYNNVFSCQDVPYSPISPLNNDTLAHPSPELEN